jgi:carboxylesterase
MNPAAAPFALGDGPDACLLLHGLTGAPSEVRPLGEALAAAGLRAVAPLLPGHGTSPRDLASVDRADLLAFATSQLAALRGARRIFLAGLSAGALLSLRLAAREQRDGVPPIAAVALLAPAVRFAGSTWLFTQVLGRIPGPSFVIDKGSRDIAAEISLAVDAPQRQSLPPGMREDGSYSAIPLSWGRELRLLSDEALADAPRVRAPALLLHGGLDRTAKPASSRLLAGRLGSAAVRLRIFPQSGHVLPRDRDSAEVCRAVVSFFREA